MNNLKVTVTPLKEKTKETAEAADLQLLQNIYTPLGDQLVFEFEINTKTKGGIELPDQVLKNFAQEESFAKQVVAVGPDVKLIKTGDYVLVNPSSRITQVPLIYSKPTGKQHGQVHEFEILGKVSKYFMLYKSSDIN